MTNALIAPAPVAATRVAPAPRRDVWLVEESEGGRAKWIRVGTATQNNDGSMTVTMTAPVGAGRLNIRPAKTADDAA